jgi:hypothetical protein
MHLTIVWYGLLLSYEFLQNVFAENERSTIKAIVNDQAFENNDFSLFLQHVIKIDAEIEDNQDG